jgi:hypothetical protein
MRDRNPGISGSKNQVSSLKINPKWGLHPSLCMIVGKPESVKPKREPMPGKKQNMDLDLTRLSG